MRLIYFLMSQREVNTKKCESAYKRLLLDHRSLVKDITQTGVIILYECECKCTSCDGLNYEVEKSSRKGKGLHFATRTCTTKMFCPIKCKQRSLRHQLTYVVCYGSCYEL